MRSDDLFHFVRRHYYRLKGFEHRGIYAIGWHGQPCRTGLVMEDWAWQI